MTLVAAPDSNSVFGGWTGACMGTSSSTTVRLNAAKTCNATFGKIKADKPKADGVKACLLSVDVGMTFSAKFPDKEGKYYIVPAEVVDAIIKAINTGTILVIDKPPACRSPIE